MPQDQDLTFLVRVQDAQLREMQKTMRALNREMGLSESVSRKSGTSGAAAYRMHETGARSARKEAAVYGASLKDIAKLSIGVGAAAEGIQLGKRFLGDSLTAASSLTEQLHKAREVFGPFADEVVDWSEETTDAIHVSQRAALEAAGSYGAMLIPMGVLPDRAVEMSKRLVELAADMASFHDQDPSAMLERIRSGISGEMEPLKRFGAVLSETRVKQFAWTSGLVESGMALTEEEKVLARYNLLLQDTAPAHGDVAETAGNWANQTRRLDAQLEDLQANLGTVLIPSLLQLAKAGNAAFDAFDRIGDSWRQLTGGDRETSEFRKQVNELVEAGATLMEARERIWGAGTFDEISKSLAASLRTVASPFEAMVDEIETQLRTKITSALEDVHEKALDTFDTETDALVSAHDRVTDGLLDSFDRTSAEMLERMRVLVSVGEEQFRIGRDQLTPAERELEALEKAERKRNVGREISDARGELAQARLVGDPEQIREAHRRLEDAERERRKITLEGRAETEREAADAALEEEERQLRESRENQREALADGRRELRDDLAERRQIQHENLDAELKAQAVALAKGKRTAAQAQEQILATLRTYGADYAGAGEELGGKYLEGFLKGILGGKPPQLKIVPADAHERQRKGAARGGIADQLGPAGPSDTIPAWLTPGELVLTKHDQDQLGRLLGTHSSGWPLLSEIRMGFAQGGAVPDEDFWRELLERFSHTLRADALAQVRGRQQVGGRGLALSALLTGEGVSDAERKMLSPVHIWAKVKSSTPAAQRAALGPAGLRELYGELAQRQAHPERAGLIRYVRGDGVVAGGRFRDPFGGGMNVNLGGATWNVSDLPSEDEMARELAAHIRSELIRTQRRNPRRRRGRNKERGL